MERATELTERYHAEIGQPGEIDWGKHADFASAAIDILGDSIAASVAYSAEKSPAPEGGEAGGAGVLREHRAPAPSSVGGLIQFSNVAASAMAKDAERYRWWRNWVFRAGSEGLPTWSPPASTQLSTPLSRHPQRREIRHEREDIDRMDRHQGDVGSAPASRKDHTPGGSPS